MEITGKLIQKLDPMSGEGKNGVWKKQNFVVETQENYPKKICFTAWGDRIDLNAIKESDIVKVFFDIESREYNNSWYTDLKPWKVEVSSNNTNSNTNFSQTNKDELPPITSDDIPFNLDSEDGDDLPF